MTAASLVVDQPHSPMGSRPRRVSSRKSLGPGVYCGRITGLILRVHEPESSSSRRRPVPSKTWSSSGGPSGGGAGCRRPPCRRTDIGSAVWRTCSRKLSKARRCLPTSAGLGTNRPDHFLRLLCEKFAPQGPFRGCRAPRVVAAGRVPVWSASRTACPRKGWGAPGRNGVRGLPGSVHRSSSRSLVFRGWLGAARPELRRVPRRPAQRARRHVRGSFFQPAAPRDLGSAKRVARISVVAVRLPRPPQTGVGERLERGRASAAPAKSCSVGGQGYSVFTLMEPMVEHGDQPLRPRR